MGERFFWGMWEGTLFGFWWVGYLIEADSIAGVDVRRGIGLDTFLLVGNVKLDSKVTMADFVVVIWYFSSQDVIVIKAFLIIRSPPTNMRRILILKSSLNIWNSVDNQQPFWIWEIPANYNWERFWFWPNGFLSTNQTSNWYLDFIVDIFNSVDSEWLDLGISESEGQAEERKDLLKGPSSMSYEPAH